MTGIVISQPDLPHWAAGILNWLAMVQQINQATGDIGKTWRDVLRQSLETGAPYEFISEKDGKRTMLAGPSSVYGVFQSFCMAVEAEANRS